MPEGLSAAEVGKEIARHAKSDDEGGRHERRDRGIAIAEAILLSVVALMAAWSGYAAAKWSTESRVTLAGASAARTNANRATLEAMELRNFDSAAFDAWFSAYTVRNEQAMKVAEHRFRPEFRVAFDAWRATKPETNPMRREVRHTCRSTDNPCWRVRRRWTNARRGRRKGRGGGRDVRQVRPHDRLSRERAVSCRHQHALPVSRRAVRAGWARRAAAARLASPTHATAGTTCVSPQRRRSC